jgi:hypothetical protein
MASIGMVRDADIGIYPSAKQCQKQAALFIELAK